MVTDSTSRIQYVAGGVSPDFIVPYAFYSQTHLEVYQNGALRTLGTHYTVLPVLSNPGLTAGGTVTFIVTPPLDDVILIIRIVPATQLVDLIDLSTFPADQVEKGLDLGVMRMQQAEESEAKSLHIPFTNISTSTLLADPALTTSWNKAIVVSGDGLSFNLLEISATDFAQPLTTKGDLVTHNGANHLRLALGTAEQVLSVANPPGTTGLVWRDLSTFTQITNVINAVEDLDKALVNPVINGDMEVWQRGTTFAAIASGTYSADRWKWEFTGTGSANIDRSTNIPATPNPSNKLFNYSLQVGVGVADAAIAAGDFYMFGTKIEGYNWRHFAQRPMVLKFFVRAAKTGTHCVALRNSGVDRSFVAEYTVNTFDTWEEKMVFISASPSSGTWNTTNGVGLDIWFPLTAGSTFHTTPGTWQTGNFLGTSAIVNEMDNVANTFRITGVQLYLSNNSIDHPFKYRTFNEELELCQRYYQKSFELGTTPASAVGPNTGEHMCAQHGGASSGVRLPPLIFRPEMRAAPTVTLFNPDAAGSEMRNQTLAANDTSTSTVWASTKSARVTATSTAGAAVNNLHAIHWTAAAEL